MIKLVLSFISIIIGWACGFLFYVIYMTFFTPWGRPTDVEAILFWTGIFIVIGWLLVVLPLIFLVQESSRLFQIPRAMTIGAVAGLVSFLALVGWWSGFWNEGLFLAYAMVVGATTGGAYAGLSRIRRRITEKANRTEGPSAHGYHHQPDS